MKVLITGAHFTPAQALIEKLLVNPDLEIVYVGRNTTIEGDKTPSVESQVLPKLGVKFIPLIAGRVSRVFSIYSLLALLKIPIGFIQAFWIILTQQPNLTVSFGGYVSVPIVFNSFLFSLPCLSHEQTLVMGLASKINSYFSNKVAVSFQNNLPSGKSKYVLTGNPIRKDLILRTQFDQKLEQFITYNKHFPLIFVTGGNQGSHLINSVIEEMLADLTQNYTLVHQTGDSKFKDFERLSQKKLNLKHPERYLIQKWFDVAEIATIFKSAQLVISRAGINTLYELAYFGIPTIVIPLPFLYKNEQMVNAKVFSEHHLCTIIKQNALSPETLLEQIRKIFKNYKTYKTGAERSKELIIPDADRRLTQLVFTLLESDE